MSSDSSSSEEVKQDRKRKKNSPTFQGPPHLFPDEVWEIFKAKLEGNVHRGGTYYTEVPTIATGSEAPETLLAEQCHLPGKSARMTVVHKKMQYQIAIHRARFMIAQYERSGQYPRSADQASHLCPDAPNVSKTGDRHCTNPAHMTLQGDSENKSRQRCAGWIWIHPYHGHAGGYWYPTCVHQPPCLVYRSKDEIPTELLPDTPLDM